MDNNKRANGIAIGIILIILGVIILALQFPIVTIIIMSGTILGFGLYQLFLILRLEIKNHLNEQDENKKWKQNKNIK
jgi:hypothetical protein